MTSEERAGKIQALDREIAASEQELSESREWCTTLLWARIGRLERKRAELWAESVRHIRLLGDRVLVKPDPAPTSVGSILVPDGALPQGHLPGDGRERETFVGTVVAVGPGDKFHERRRGFEIHRTLIHRDGSRAPMHVRVGDRVLYPRRPPSERGTDEGTGDCGIYLDGERYLLFHEEQAALAIIGE